MKPTNKFWFWAFSMFMAALIMLSSCEKKDKVNVPEIITFEVNDITQISATSGGQISYNGGAEVTARGLCWSKVENPSISDTRTEEGIGSGSFTSIMSELERNTTYYVRAYATNSAGTGYGNELSFTTGIVDADGNVYPTVIIGNQEWFAENLRSTRYNDGTPIATGHTDQEWENLTTGALTIYPHYEIEGLNSDAEVLETYGALYNWYAVETGNLCPDGWHVPTHDEWITLGDYAGGLSIAGGRLKSSRTYPDAQPRWESPNTGATDDYGFSAVPGGYRRFEGTFYLTGEYCNFWSSSAVSWDEAWGRRLSNDSESLSQMYYAVSHGFSIRCLKD